MIDRDADLVRSVAARLDGRAIAIGADVTDANAMAAAVAQAVDTFGGIDLVIANAGIPTRGATTVDRWQPDELERVLAVNVTGVWNTVRSGLPYLESGGRLAL